MPNHCENHTYVYGPKESLLHFAHAVKMGHEGISIANLIPCPAERQGDNLWCDENWGTKWGDYDHHEVHGVEDVTDSIELVYLTAWRPFGPQFWERVSANWPGLSFVTTYEEAGMEVFGATAARNGVVGVVPGDYPESPVDWDDEDEVDAYRDLLDEMRSDLHAAACRLLSL
jgi:hypothetical protein